MKTAMEELEGRLNAQRELLVTLLAALIEQGASLNLSYLDQETTPNNGEEDPGVVPSNAYALEAAAADEIRSILDAARARAKALAGQSSAVAASDRDYKGQTP